MILHDNALGSIGKSAQFLLLSSSELHPLRGKSKALFQSTIIHCTIIPTPSDEYEDILTHSQLILDHFNRICWRPDSQTKWTHLSEGIFPKVGLVLSTTQLRIQTITNSSGHQQRLPKRLFHLWNRLVSPQWILIFAGDSDDSNNDHCNAFDIHFTYPDISVCERDIWLRLRAQRSKN